MAVQDKWLIVKVVFLLSCIMLGGFYATYHLIDSVGEFLGVENLARNFPTASKGMNIERRSKKGQHNQATYQTTSSASSVSTQSSTWSDGTSSYVQPSSEWLFSSSTSTSSSTSSSASSISTSSSTPSFSSVSTSSPSSLSTSTGSSTSSGSSTDTATTTTAPKSCTEKRYPIKDSCVIDSFIESKYGAEITLEEVGDLLFSLPIIDRLVDTCTPGDWCVTDDWGLVTDDDDYFDFCFIGDCLIEKMPEDCLSQERRLYLSTLSLLCGATQTNTSDICFLSLRKMTSVTLALLKHQINDKNTTDTCTVENTATNCSETCHEFAKGLHCMCQICDHHTELFDPFQWWQWYFKDDKIDVCHISNTTDCAYLGSPTESWFDGFMGKLNIVTVTDMSDGKVLTGLIVAGVVMVTGLAVSVWVCVRKDCTLRGYRRNRVEYMEVGDEDDDIYG